MSETPETIGLVSGPFGFRLWNREDDSTETSAIRYVRADRIEALEREVKEFRADIETFWKPQFDEQVERAEAAEAREARLSEALRGATASLVAAVSLLKRGSKKAAPSDRMFDQMILDYEKSIEEARAALSGSGSGWRGSYRLLGTTDTIQTGDEVIGDDGVTWCPVDRWSIGCEVSRLFKSIRRALPAAPQQGGE